MKKNKVLNKERIFLNCNYIPQEIFAAAGLKPERPWPIEIGDKGQELVPYDFCPYSRAFLSYIRDNRGLSVCASSCDAMRRIYDAATAEAEEIFFLEVPRSSTPRNSEFYYQQLVDLLYKMGIDPSESEYKSRLREVISEYNRNRQELKEKCITVINDDSKSFLKVLETVGNINTLNTETSDFKKEKLKYKHDSPRILLVSSCLLDDSLIKLIEDINLKIVGIDSCQGERAFDFEVEVDTDPLRALARDYLAGILCPRTAEPVKRIERIKKLLETRKAGAVIYFIPKFCDQAIYDYKYLKEWSSKKDIYMLQLEGEYQSGLRQGLKTRVMALKESLENYR